MVGGARQAAEAGPGGAGHVNPSHAPLAIDVPRQARDASGALQEGLGDHLLALYLYGSFVEGGLRAQSDIDLLAVVRRPLTPAERAALMRSLLAFSAYPASNGLRPLEVTCLVLSDIQPWRHPARRELQFGEWLRPELEAGTVPPPEPDPDIALLIAQARAKGIALHGPAAAELLPGIPREDIRAAILAMMPEVARNWRGEEKHALLTLARMWVTLRTGDIVAKDVAAARALAEMPGEHHAVLLHAVAVYRGESEEDLSEWPAEVEACARWFVQAVNVLTQGDSPRLPSPR